MKPSIGSFLEWRFGFCSSVWFCVVTAFPGSSILLFRINPPRSPLRLRALAFLLPYYSQGAVEDALSCNDARLESSGLNRLPHEG
jgi:hypothetical protein